MGEQWLVAGRCLCSAGCCDRGAGFAAAGSLMGVALGLALLLLALLALVWALRLRKTTGLPWAPVLYRDTGGSVPEKPLIARNLGLVGKPDYLLELRGQIIPVEVKPGRRARYHTILI